MAEIPSHPVFGSTTGWNGMRKKSGGGGGGAGTSKVRVRIAEFDDDDDCACSLTSTYEIWENNSEVNPGAGDLTLSVDDWISGGSASKGGGAACAQVVSLNETGTAVGTTDTEYADCAACNTSEALCGGAPGGP